MTGKIIFLLTFASILSKTDAFKQLNANIDKMIANVEKHTKGLMEDGKAIVLYNRTTSNDNDTHSYMIQKEREKLSIIPMLPIGIKSSGKSVENQDDDSLLGALYDIENGSGDSNEEEPVPEPEPADKKNKKDITNPTAKKPCSCGKLIKAKDKAVDHNMYWFDSIWRNRKFKASRDYIVGGDDTLEHQHPWQVYIEKLDLPEKSTKEHGNDYSDYEYEIDPHGTVSHGHFMGFWRNNKLVKKNHFGKFLHGHGDISGMIQSRASRGGRGNTKGSARFLCGGTLISEQHVLTAAHCFNSSNSSTVLKDLQVPIPLPIASKLSSTGGLHSIPKPESLRVSLGAHQLNGPKDTNHVKVSDIKIHPEFNSFAYDNDFAILTLEKPVTFNEKIQQVCLPKDTERDLFGKTAKITGWGVSNLDKFSSLAKTLQVANVKIESHEICQESYGSVVINDRKICAWDRGIADSCRGDSGGPLVIEKNDQSAIYGVTSFGLSCAHHMFPGVYAKITENVKTWIKTVTTGTQDDCDRDYFFWRKMKKSADFEADDYDSQEEEEDQSNPIKIGKNVDNRRAKVRSSEMSKRVKAVESAGGKKSSIPKEENDLSYVRRLLALLQAQGKM